MVLGFGFLDIGFQFWFFHKMDKDIRIWMIGFSLTDQINRIWFFSFSDLVRVFLGYGFEILDKSIKNKKKEVD